MPVAQSCSLASSFSCSLLKQTAMDLLVYFAKLSISVYGGAV